MAVAPQTSEVLSPKEILELADKRIKKFAVRDALYDVYNLYYYGERPSEGSFNVLAMNNQGRPLLRDLGSAMDKSRAYSSQRLAPIVDDYQALLGRMPHSQVEPPDGSPEGETKAVLLTKYLISTHELSDMERQQDEVGFHLPGLGDACYYLGVEPEQRRVVWEILHPRTCYPEFYRGYKRFQIYDLVQRVYMDPDVIKREYGFMPKTDEEADCTVTIYTSPYQRTVLIGVEKPKLGPEVQWDLGFCPAQWVFNKVNGRFAQSDIGQSLQQQDFLDFAYNVLIDGLVHMTYPLVGIRNPQNVGEDQIVVGAGAPPIMLQDDGDIIVRPLGGTPEPAMRMIQEVTQDINTTTGTSQVRQEGQMHGSIQTGRAIHAAQGPQGTRIELKQQALAGAFRNANQMTLAMQEKAPLLGHHKFEIYGRYKGQSFRTVMSGEDIDGWHRNTVSWDSMIGMNLQQKTAIAYEGMMAGLYDDLHGMQQIGIDDPLGMRERIAAMKLHQAQIEGQVQAAIGGQGGAPAAGGGAPAQGPEISWGTGGMVGRVRPSEGPEQQGKQPAPMLMRPFGAQQQAPPGVAGGVPQGTSRKAVEAALAAVASKLRGTVYATGDLAKAGQALRISVTVTEGKDYQLVLQEMRRLDPRAKVSHEPETKLPPEAVRVA